MARGFFDESRGCCSSDFYHLNSIDNITECKRLLIMDIPGISADKVDVKTEWINSTKELYLHITIKETEEVSRGIRKLVDTTIYDKYSWEVKDGRLTITLYEIINEQPKFELITEDK